MSLSGFQAALGRSVRAMSGGRSPAANESRGTQARLTAAERSALDRLFASRGFHFTARIQRSWCAGRAANAARLTLTLVPSALRSQLLDEWVCRGGGTSSFFTAEADGLLRFLAMRLPRSSPAAAMARIERALILAGSRAPDPVSSAAGMSGAPAPMVRRSSAANLVGLRFAPHHLLAALDGGPTPRPLARPLHFLFAPGVPRLFRPATSGERVVWRRLARPRSCDELFADPQEGRGLHDLLLAEAVEAVPVGTTARTPTTSSHRRTA